MPFDLSSAKPVEFDLGSAKPEGAPSAPPSSVAPEKPASASDALMSMAGYIPGVAPAETALSMATGTAGGIAGGLEQAAAALYEGLRDPAATGIPASPDAPHEYGKAIAESMTYEPRTPQGKQIMGVLSYLGIPFQYAADKIREFEKSQTGGTTGSDVGLGMLSAGGPFTAGIVGRGKTAKPSTMTEETFKEGREHGYVATPSAVRKGVTSNIMESVSPKSKITASTSIKNAEARARDIRKELGLPEGTEIRPEELENLRDAAYQHYLAVEKQAPTVSVTPKFSQAVDDLVKKHSDLVDKYPSLVSGPTRAFLEGKTRSLMRQSHNTSDVLSLVQELRQSADFNLSVEAGKRLDPGKKRLGQFQYHLAGELENLVDENLSAKGSPQAVQNLRDARTLIAKTYDVQSALNPYTGEVDAAKLVQMADKKPLSGALARAARQARAFPSDHRSVSRIGGHPSFSAWDFLVAGGAAAAGHPGVAAGELASRFSAPSVLASDWYQNRILPGRPPAAIRQAGPFVPGALTGIIAGLPGQQETK